MSVRNSFVDLQNGEMKNDVEYVIMAVASSTFKAHKNDGPKLTQPEIFNVGVDGVLEDPAIVCIRHKEGGRAASVDRTGHPMISEVCRSRWNDRGLPEFRTVWQGCLSTYQRQPRLLYDKVWYYKNQQIVVAEDTPEGPVRVREATLGKGTRCLAIYVGDVLQLAVPLSSMHAGFMYLTKGESQIVKPGDNLCRFTAKCQVYVMQLDVNDKGVLVNRRAPVEDPYIKSASLLGALSDSLLGRYINVKKGNGKSCNSYYWLGDALMMGFDSFQHLRYLVNLGLEGLSLPAKEEFERRVRKPFNMIAVDSGSISRISESEYCGDLVEVYSDFDRFLGFACSGGEFEAFVKSSLENQVAVNAVKGKVFSKTEKFSFSDILGDQVGCLSELMAIDRRLFDLSLAMFWWEKLTISGGKFWVPATLLGVEGVRQLGSMELKPKIGFDLSEVPRVTDDRKRKIKPAIQITPDMTSSENCDLKLSSGPVSVVLK